jgi:hypothetical protein
MMDRGPITLPFAKRTTVIVAVFACLGVAAPETILRTLTMDVGTTNALDLEYVQLLQIYTVLRRQDIMNQRAVLVAAVVDALTLVGNLNTTISMMTASGDNGLVLARLQTVTRNAWTQIIDVLFDMEGNAMFTTILAPVHKNGHRHGRLQRTEAVYFLILREGAMIHEKCIPRASSTDKTAINTA